MAGKPTEIGIQRTAPDAAALVVERTIDGARHGGERAPGRRRSTVVGITLLAVGITAMLASIVILGSRIGATAETVRGTGLDATSVFFSGTAGSGAELTLVIVLLLLVPVGLVLAALGYRRVTDDGPSAPAVHVSNTPNSHIGRHASIGG